MKVKELVVGRLYLLADVMYVDNMQLMKYLNNQVIELDLTPLSPTLAFLAEKLICEAGWRKCPYCEKEWKE